MIPIRRRLYQSLAGFTPRQLFSAMQGAWLEPTPGYIWQENTGATPTTTGGQTIGLMLDQSQGAVLDAELITNGDFSGGTTGWTAFASTGSTPSLSAATGQLVVTKVSAADGCGAYQTFTTQIGKWYTGLATYVGATGSAAPRFRLGTNAGGTQNASVAPTAGQNIAIRFLATATTTFVSMMDVGSATTFTWDNISVREIAGNHAAQSTAANRSAYQLDSNGLPLARHDTNDSLVVNLPNLGGGVFSSSGSVYFATPVGMSALHNQSMGTTYTLPALSTDIYSWIVVPQRLSTALEGRLERYMLRKAGLSVPDYLTDDLGEILTDDIGDPLLAG